MDLNPQDAYLLEKVADPNSLEFQHLMDLLVKPADQGVKANQKLSAESKWKYIFPFRGDPESEAEVRNSIPFGFPERGFYRNGVSSLAHSIADVVDLVEMNSGKRRVSTTLCISEEFSAIQSTLASAGSVSTLVFYSNLDSMVGSSLRCHPETIIVDHTTSMIPIDELLNLAYRAGITVVDGVFPYHVAAVKGWDVVTGPSKWSFTHSASTITIGPDDDATRMMKYKKSEYIKFLEPSNWKGNSRKYGYELRKMKGGLVTYRAVYLGGADVSLPKESLTYSLPICSSDEMVLITINRELAAGVFSSRSTNASQLAGVEKNYAIEVRKDLFNSCVDYLISKERGTDIVGEAVRYVAQHNYVDLMDGVRIVRCPSLSYADALCTAMVCSLTAFSLRYKLTNESVPDILRTKVAAGYAHDAPLGFLGRLVWMAYTYITDPLHVSYTRSMARARQILYSTDFIPGLCYDVYATSTYSPEMNWFEPNTLELRIDEPPTDYDRDLFTNYLGDSVKTAAPSLLRTGGETMQKPLPEARYVHNVTDDPIATLQHVYDVAFPGNSVTSIQNVAEYRRVKDVNVNTEFYGKVEVNKDIAAPEKLHSDMPLRTAALPVSRTPLLDAIMASAKRNFNPPDLQLQSDPWAYAQFLVRRFVDFAFVPRFTETIGKAYKKDPLTFNVMDYIEWRALRDENYRSALEAECPEDMVELDLNRYDTIVKKRIKPKLSVAAQSELSQPQVIVSLKKKDTALFTSVFRKVFERFDSALRPEMKSAGRMSDADISEWLTRYKGQILSLEAIELDATKYDKSQGLLARMIESLLFVELGLDPSVNEIFSDSYVGKVSSRSLGLMFVSAYQMKSGAPQTMLGNLVYNMVTVTEAVGAANIALMIAKGDDNVVWIRNLVNKTSVVDKMSNLFNLEIKLISGMPIYFSSGYFVPVGDYVYFVPDPLKIIELLGEGGGAKDTAMEQFVSFSDRVSSMAAHHSIPSVLQTLVRTRLGVPNLDVVAAVDALCTITESFSTFERLKFSV